MTNKPDEVSITIDFRNPDLDDEELEELTQRLREEMLDLDEVIDVERVLDPNPPEGNKGLGAGLIGLLVTQVKVFSIKALFGFLADRLGNKSITMEIEANGKKLKVIASNQQELLAVVQTAQQFITSA
jgi:hypothetical protein